MAKKEVKTSKPKVENTKVDSITAEIKFLQSEITNLNEMIVVHAKKIESLEYVIEQHKALISTMRGRLGV